MAANATACVPGPADPDDAPAHHEAVIVLERALTERFGTEEHRRFCEFLDRATATLVEQTPGTSPR